MNSSMSQNLLQNGREIPLLQTPYACFFYKIEAGVAPGEG